MSKWVNKLDLSDLWKKRDTADITVIEMGKEIAKRIRKMNCYEKYIDELEDIADQFKNISESVEEFDDILCQLYDWGDISLDGKFGGKKMCWIKTIY
jgi:predicted hydrocarbon binding protein